MKTIEIKHIPKELNVHSYHNCEIKTIDINSDDEAQYDLFFEEFMFRNIPCIIKNVSTSWDCSKNWVLNGGINVQYLSDKYGDLDAPVANCDNINFNSHCKSTMKVKDYMEYLKTNSKDQLLYLKDWHLRRICPDDNFYEVPVIFGSDWLNEYAVDHQDDDFMFVYIGPKNSWTPLHADVYGSYSWSVNVIGKKKWVFFPPGEEDKLKNDLGNLPLMFNHKSYENIKYFEIVQEKGDAIFVPSGWHHQVLNLLDTISINHNWINACNLEEVWNVIQKTLSSVEKEIEEFKDTPEYTAQCQLILKSLFGMDYTIFIKFICYIAKKRLNQLETKNYQYLDRFSMGKNHIMFDLFVILRVMGLIESNIFFSKHLLPDIKIDFIHLKNSIIILDF